MIIPRAPPTAFDMQPTLVGDLLQIRPLQQPDFDALYAVTADPKIWEQHPTKDRWKLEVFSELFDRLLGSGGGLVIIEKQSGIIIGSSSYYEYRSAERDIVVGYTFLARRCWGGLYNSKLKLLMLRQAFQYVDRVWFHVGAENWRSQRAMEKVRARLSHKAIRESGGVFSEFLHYVIEKS